MAQDNLRRLIDLAQKTGDTLIVTDKSGHEPVVIMDVSKYEALLDLGLFADDGDISYEEPMMEMADVEGYEEEDGSSAPEILEELASEPSLEPLVQDVSSREHPHPAMESVIHQDDSGSEGEERFYLEPIE